MADCGIASALCDVAKDVVGGVAKSGSEALGDQMMQGWDSAMKSFLTSWLDVPLLVDLSGSSVKWLTDQLQVLTLFFAVVGIMVACIWTMLAMRGDRMKQVAGALIRTFLIATVGTTLVQVVMTASDAFSKWILDNAGVSAAGYKPLAALAASAPGIAIIAGIFGILATFFQWGIMLLRAVILPLLVAVWPLSASVAMVRGGEEAFSKVTKWLIAFLLFKPVAAIIYAFAWKLRDGQDGIGGIISGLILVVVAVAALPTLMKLVAPGVGVLGDSSGGGMAVAAGAAVVSAGVAAGSMVMTGGASAGASAGAAGSAGSAGGAGMASAGGASAAGGGSSALQAASSEKSSAASGGSSSGGSSSGFGQDSLAGGSRSGSSGSGPGGASGMSSAEWMDKFGNMFGFAEEGPAGASGSANFSGNQLGSSGPAAADGAQDSDGKDVIGNE